MTSRGRAHRKFKHLAKKKYLYRGKKEKGKKRKRKKKKANKGSLEPEKGEKRKKRPRPMSHPVNTKTHNSLHYSTQECAWFRKGGMFQECQNRRMNHHERQGIVEQD